jgi:hypothetical protein
MLERFNFRFSEICALSSPVPCPSGGAYASSRTLARDCDGRPQHHATSDAAGGRRRRVVLISRRWDQPLGLKSPGGTVAIKPGHRGERAISRKPLRREGRVAPVEPVTTRVLLALVSRTRDRGCNQHPAFPAPSARREHAQSSDASRRETDESRIRPTENASSTSYAMSGCSCSCPAAEEWLPQRNDCCAIATIREHLAAAVPGSCSRRFLATPLHEMMFLESFQPRRSRELQR